MPKAPRAHKTQRAAPYAIQPPSTRSNPPIATTTSTTDATNSTMAAQVAGYYAMTHHHSNDWAAPHMYATQHSLMPLNDVMNPLPPTPHQVSHPSPSPQVVQSGPWTNQEDEILCKYRLRGLGWNQIQEQHFPNKSANACRKRYERLMTKRRSTDWDEARLEKLAVCYREMRPQIWGPMAARLGEKWEHVEKACMQQGLKSLQTLAANHKRTHSNASSRHSHPSSSEAESWHYQEEHDSLEDSGISLGMSASERPASGGGNIAPGWQDQLLQPPPPGHRRLHR